jgi:hypothetical protein
MNDTQAICNEIDEITADVRASFGALTPDQLNWKPAADSWSIAQCLDHLILTNTQMLPAIDGKIAGGGNSFWENWSPLTGYFGRFLSGTMTKDEKKFKAPSKAIVPPSDIDVDIVDNFAENNRILKEKISACGDLDWRSTVVTSPFMRLMTYRLADGVDILVGHEKRHIRQAKRVVETPGFPAAASAAASPA